VYYSVVQEENSRTENIEDFCEVNNPTGRNKLVFSSEEAVYYISELINTGCYIQNLHYTI
jgi:hypothetical protein